MKIWKKTISDIYKKSELESLRNRFINQLPRGNYQMGMRMISIDHLLDESEEKSDFYKEVIHAAESELQITEKTHANEFPLILINEKPANFKIINSLDVAKVESYKILPETATTTAIYGEKGENGVILVTTR